MESGGVILFVSVGVVFTAHKYNENTLPVYQKKKKKSFKNRGIGQLHSLLLVHVLEPLT